MDISIFFIVPNGKNKYIWRCTEYNKYKCSSCFTSTKDETGTILKESCHSHAPNGVNIQVRELMEKIKDNAKSNQVCTRNLISEAVATVPLVVAAQLPSQSLISRTIRRVRSCKDQVCPQNPLTVNDLNIGTS
ncbi:unnamed protein product [Aphis gossypii]|uniref:FLYWCH-type domain-containing protein n=1 Tax=Aphis gossypii TaxID=80765 RepID=A0A9P0IND7_APHGO|nr:unnamed protein product [Aphis gossypii]